MPGYPAALSRVSFRVAEEGQFGGLLCGIGENQKRAAYGVGLIVTLHP
jgi:hypothetical protein